MKIFNENLVNNFLKLIIFFFTSLSFMSIRTLDFIRKIRNCKTAAEERDVISKESALIRTSFKNDESEYRARNISKVIYIHIAGYPTHFAQIECLKLIASNNYGDKRIGYLASMLLIDENQEVITLLTNTLKKYLSTKALSIIYI